MIAEKSKYIATKIRSGKYLYRGYVVSNLGYYQPEQKVVWEAHDESTGEAVAHGYTKKEVLLAIDGFLELA